MWKRKSIATVQEMQPTTSWGSSNSPSASTPTPSQSLTPSTQPQNQYQIPIKTQPTVLRKYDITAVSPFLRQFKVKDHPTRRVLYTLAMGASFGAYNVVLTTGEPAHAEPENVAATAKVSLFRTVTQLVVGNPGEDGNGSGCVNVEMKLDSKWKHNAYAMELPLASGEVVKMLWKGTNEVKGFMKKMDRGMHHKLVQVCAGSETGGGKGRERLLARYVHDPWNMDVAGSVEICADIDDVVKEWWDLFVLCSALAVAEKNTKLVKMSLHAM